MYRELLFFCSMQKKKKKKNISAVLVHVMKVSRPHNEMFVWTKRTLIHFSKISLLLHKEFYVSLE